MVGKHFPVFFPFHEITPLIFQDLPKEPMFPKYLPMYKKNASYNFATMVQGRDTNYLMF
jgi:hypothetical protein